MKNLAAAGSARQRQQPTCGGKVWQSARSQELPVLAARGGDVLRPEGSELGRARGGTDGLDGELLLLPARNPTNTSIPLYPPLQPEMLYRARTGEVGKAVLIFVQISPNILCLCANITQDSLNAITSYLKLEPFQHPQKTVAASFVQKKAR